MTTSTARSLAVPQSQNTAEVFEFRCMFTHDLRRKQKRWQDGFLTYHTFNKRIVVYDESRNRMGDAHWRKDHDFGEGEELQLQQGLLIDVQDKLGSKEQDISGVVVTRDTNKTPQLPSSNPSPWKAVTTIGPSGSGPQTTTLAPASMPGQPRRPKTLNEILQTPRAVLGKARLPESPYQQRHAASSDIPAGREPVVMCKVAGFSRPAPSEENPKPNKKQKRDNTAVGPETPKRKTSALLQTKKLRPNAPKNAAPIASVNLPDNPIIIESDDEMLDDFTPDRPVVPPETASKTPVSRKSKSSTAPLIAKKSSKAKTAGQTQLGKEAAQKAQGGRVLSTATEVDRRANPLRERPVNTLKPASGQPRRKLMYRELLPSNFVSRNPRSQSTSTNIGKERSITPTEPSTSNRPSAKSPCTSRPSSRPTEACRSNISAAETLPPARFDQIDANSLRSQSPSPHDLSVDSRPAPVLADADKATTDDLFPTEGDGLLIDPHLDGMEGLDFDTLPLEEDDTLQIDPFSEVESFDMLENAPTLADLAELDKALIASKQRHLFRPASDLAKASVPPVTAPPKKSGGLGAVIAAANNRMLEETTKRSPWQRTRTEPVINSPKAAQSRRSPLKKTNSDQTGRSDQPPEPIVTEKDGEKGPWSREAFDLFGWKPGNAKAFITVVDV